jgi:DNA-binding transcriptional MerR regulator
MGATATKQMTVGEAAQQLGCREWQLRSLFNRGRLPEPERIGRFRLIDSADLPKIRQALVDAGYQLAE